jgi:uncharacterized membrane protein
LNSIIVKEISATAIFAALYATAVVALTPISFSIFQIRVADAFLPLAIMFSWPTITGVTLGTIIANFFGGLGMIDVLGGSAANFAATFLAWRIGRMEVKGSWLYAIAIEVVTVTLIVGTYLSYLLNLPLAMGFSGILLGSVIAIGVLGYILLKAISRPSLVGVLRSYGLKLYLKRQV